MASPEAYAGELGPTLTTSEWPATVSGRSTVARG